MTDLPDPVTFLKTINIATTNEKIHLRVMRVFSIVDGSIHHVLIYFAGAGIDYDKLRESVDAGFPELDFELNAS